MHVISLSNDVVKLGNMASIATILLMANYNLSSNRYSQNNLNGVSFATLAIFSRIVNADHSSRPVESRKSVMQVLCYIRVVLYYKNVRLFCQKIPNFMVQRKCEYMYIIKLTQG